MPTAFRSLTDDQDRLASDLMLPTDYPLKEALGIYARRVGVLLTSSAMILGIGILSVWFSVLLIPILYLASAKVRTAVRSAKVREIVRRRLKDSLLSLGILALGFLVNKIFDLGLFASLFIYVLGLVAVVAIFRRN